MKVEAVKSQERQVETLSITVKDSGLRSKYEKKLKNYIMHIKEQRKIKTI